MLSDFNQIGMRKF